MPPALLIDVDGTLIDSNALHVLAWLRAFRRLGHEQEGCRILDLMGMGGDQLAPEVLGKDAGDEIARAKAFYAQEYSGKGLVAHAEPLPGAVALLRELRRRGIRVALASSGEQKDIDRYVELLGGREAFTELVGSADVEATKPEPDIFGVALDRLGNPERAIVIGDTPYDVDAAARLGLPCIAVLTGGFARSRLEQAGAAAVVIDAAALLARLDDVLAGDLAAPVN